MKEYTIDRSKWVCGGKRFSKKLGMTHMLNDKGRMCCLGQIYEAEGVSREDLIDETSPFSVWIAKKINPTDWMLTIKESNACVIRQDHSRVSKQMMRVNDDDNLNQKERENKLKELALKVDVKLKFTGKLGVK